MCNLGVDRMKIRRRDVLAGMTAVTLTIVGVPPRVRGQVEPPREAPTKPGEYRFIFRARVDGKPMQMTYALILPVGYDTEPGRKFPMVVFTHGAGEVGTDGNGLFANGPTMELHENHPFKETFPFIVLAPQCPPRGERWDQPQMYKAVSLIIDAAIRSVRVDADRVYSTGLSMGGKGCWLATMEGAERFAAMSPMCAGTTHPEAAQKLRFVAVWMTAGQEDGDAVNHNAEMWKILQNNPAEVRNTIVPGVGHDVWVRFYASAQFYEWLLMHKRPTASERQKMIAAGPWLQQKQVPPRAAGHYRLNMPVQINGQPVQMICSLFVNKAYSPSGSPTPLLLFLHEYNTIGLPAVDQVLHGPAAMLEAKGNELFKQSFPMAVFSPVLPAGMGTWEDKPIRDAVIAAVTFDKSRVYVAGVNEGATAVWQLAGDHKDLFAAGVLVGAPEMPRTAKFDVPQNADASKEFPLWALSTQPDAVKGQFEGKKGRKLTPIAKSAISAGTLYTAFKNKDLYDWLLEQKKA
jgi:predicted peptidase